jgi:hypothetical protein
MSKAGLAGVGSQAAFAAADSQIEDLKRTSALSDSVSYINGAPVKATPVELVEECLRTANSVLKVEGAGENAAFQGEIALYAASRVIEKGVVAGQIAPETVTALRAQMDTIRNDILSIKERPVLSLSTPKTVHDVPENNGNM